VNALLGWVLAAIAGAALARAVTVGSGPPLHLKPHRVQTESPAQQVLAELRADLESAPNVAMRSHDGVVAKFEGKAGRFSYQTVELIRFADQQITFEHLRGPFRSSIETIEAVQLEAGRSALEHRGQFVMRGGIAGWLLGELVVRRVFERLVASHMEGIAGTSAIRP